MSVRYINVLIMKQKKDTLIEIQKNGIQTGEYTVDHKDVKFFANALKKEYPSSRIYVLN